MIDIETLVFSQINKRMRERFSKDIYLTGEYVRVPPEFPAVTIMEMDNVQYQRTQDSGSNERHALLHYEVNIYSNKCRGKKTEAKTINKIIDEEFNKMGMSRIMSHPIPNENDPSVYRITTRYRGVVDTNNTIYRG